MNNNIIYEKLKSEINKKYKNISPSENNSLSRIVTRSESGSLSNSNDNNEKNENISIIKKQKDNSLSIQPSSNNNSNREVISELKQIHNKLENEYILLLKQLSKKILKPKDLVKKVDPTYMSNKIK